MIPDSTRVEQVEISHTPCPFVNPFTPCPDREFLLVSHARIRKEGYVW
jgi:hypothetical protein